MTHQAPLIPTRHAPDIWRRFRLPGGHVNAAPWEDARAQGGFVGTCRNPATATSTCGGYLRPGPPYAVGGRQFFPTVCKTCGNETAAPGPAPTRKRTRNR